MIPVTGAPDLWCTYAAVRTLAWLGRADRTPNLELTARYLHGRRNPDGGYAWSRGMPSDAWATFYCASALTDLGQRPAGLAETARWLREAWSQDAYAMMPGQDPDVWATHFATRTAVEICRDDVPDRRRLLAWLGALQTADGGLSWTPAHAERGDADVRACYYGVAAWRALCAAEPVDPPWDVAALTGWLRRQQMPGGGFRFGPEATVPCLWATYRAVGALAALGAATAAPCADWILGQRNTSGGFVRWPGYPVADVWAGFSAVGALRALSGVPVAVADAVEKRVAELACPEGGFTYREPEAAADVLTVAATLLAAGAADDGDDGDGDGDGTPGDHDRTGAELRRWLEGCRLPNEGGVMYMPGRGAEIRCTLWALAAGAFRDDPAARRDIADWLGRMQNPDGGYGFWHGRGSDLVSTAAAVEIHRLLGSPVRDGAALAAFVARCDRGEDGAGNVPGAPATLRAGLHAARVRAFLGDAQPARVAALLDRHRVRGGGWADQGNRLPDLLSTYQAVVTADRLGIPVDRAHLGAFLARTSAAGGVSWSPLAPADDDPLATCLHRLLARRRDDPSAVPPALTLS